MDDDTKKIIDRLSSFKLELIEINSEAHRSNNIELAREKFDRLEERIISYLEKSVSVIEAQRFKDISYPINVNWWKTFDYRFKAKTAFLDALMFEIKNNADFLLIKGKNNMKDQEELKNDSKNIASNESNWFIKYGSFILSALFFATGLIIKTFKPIIIFGFSIENIFFILIIITAFVFLIIILNRFLRDSNRRIIKEKRDGFIVIIVFLCILIFMPFFITLNYKNSELSELKNKVEIYEKSPLTINEFYDFESVAEDNFENSSWKAIPESQKYELSISNEYGRKSNKSLKLYGSSGVYDWQDPTKSNNYFSIIYWDYENNKPRTLTAKALSVWVFIPKSDMYKDDNFFVHIAIYKEYQGSSTEIENLQVFSNDIVLVQGKWVPLFLGFESTIVPDNDWENSINNKGIDIDEIKISVFNTTKGYNGSIYFDDICIFE